MKKLFISLLLMIGTLANAQLTTNITITGNGSNLVAAAAMQIVGITLAGNGTSAATVRFYDNNTNGTMSFLYTNAAYSTRISYATNLTSVYTNASGIVQTNTYPGLATVSNYVASVSNNVPVSFTGVVPVNGIATYAVDLIHTKGLMIRSDTNVTVTVTYYQPF